MSKTMAVLDDSNQVINIVVSPSEQEETKNLIAYLDENPAYIGGDYFEGYFYPAQPYSSWTRNNGTWESPIPYPTDGLTYSWNEADLAWELQDFSEPEA